MATIVLRTLRPQMASPDLLIFDMLFSEPYAYGPSLEGPSASIRVRIRMDGSLLDRYTLAVGYVIAQWARCR